MTMIVLRSIGQLFCRLSFIWDLSNASLMIRLELWVLGRKTTEVKCHFHHIILRIHIVNLIYHCWYWTMIIWQNECLSDFSTIKLFSFFPFHTVLLRIGSYALHLWEWSIYINYLKFFYMEVLSFSLFIHSSIYISMDSWIFILYTLNYNPST